MGDRLRIVIVTTVIAVLIWAFAEGQSVRSQSAEVQVRLDEGGPTRYLRVLDDAWGGTLRARFEGSNAAVDGLIERLRDPVRLTAGVDLPGTPGEHIVDLRVALRQSEAFRGVGVTIAELEPATIRVLVGALVVRELAVRVELPEGQADGVPEVNPATVRVELPAAVAEGLPSELAAIARISPDRLRGLEPGRRHVLGNVPLELPAEVSGVSPVRLEPTGVGVAFTLRSRTTSIELPTVPVHIKMAAVAFNDWLVVPQDPFLRDVIVTGPVEEIERIQSGQTRITGTLELSVDDLERAAREGGEAVFTARFATLPTPLRFEVDDATVRVRVERRPPEPAPGG